MASRGLRKKGSGRLNGAGVDRYKHDLEQVKLMTKGKGKAQADDVTLGLRGLDEAERLRDKGDDAAALKIYQSSIELLIRYLQSAPSPTRSSPPIDHAVVEERVRAALSEAEELKASVQSKEKQKPEAAQRSLSSTIYAALTGSSSGKSTEQQQASASSSPQSALTQSSSKGSPVERQPVRSPSSTSTARRKGSLDHQKDPSQGALTRSSSKGSPVERQPVRSPSSTATARRRASLDYRNDPLVQTVKADLYVDPSELENTKWEDICGLDFCKQSLQEAAIFPLLRPDLFTGLRKPQNVLLYGPPGTGKTMLVRAVARESSCLLFACTASALTSKWHGEGEKLVRTLFRLARDVAPSIIFIDEMDSLLSSRSDAEHEASRRFKTEFMVQMDGIVKGTSDDVQHGVLVLGCTNCPWDVDDAVLRRFPRRIYVPLPDADARRGLINNLLQKAGKHNLTSRHVSKLVSMTDGYSCSDICSLASDAAFGPLRSLGDMNAIRNVRTQDVRPISVKDFEDAINSSLKSVSPALLEKYRKWEQQQGAP